MFPKGGLWLWNSTADSSGWSYIHKLFIAICIVFWIANPGAMLRVQCWCAKKLAWGISLMRTSKITYCRIQTIHHFRLISGWWCFISTLCALFSYFSVRLLAAILMVGHLSMGPYLDEPGEKSARHGRILWVIQWFVWILLIWMFPKIGGKPPKMDGLYMRVVQDTICNFLSGYWFVVHL